MPAATTMEDPPDRPTVGGERVAAVAVVWSADEPDRVGEVALVPPGGGFIGRADDALPFVRQRPGRTIVVGPLMSPHLSRQHLRVERATGGGLTVDALGRAPIVARGRVVQRVTLPPGELIAVGGSLLLLVTERPAALPAPLVGAAWPDFPFGAADPFGIVGESPAIWELRERVAFAGPRPLDALVTGPSGTGKELVARALHALSPRARRPLVSRSAATLPEGLIDAELFGNVRNYPNAGMPERPGLVGEADGSTLFLDEVGDLDPGLQAHLLRLCDSGEYQRLGDARPRRADLRLVAATNRAESSLKFDLLARFRLRLTLPGLDARREDIPLLVRHLLVAIAAQDEVVARRFGLAPALSQRFAAALLRRPWATNVRELETLLWLTMSAAPGPLIDGDVSDSEPTPADPATLAPDTIRAALEQAGGRQEVAWRELGLSSRFVLRRLMEKHGIR